MLAVLRKLHLTLVWLVLTLACVSACWHYLCVPLAYSPSVYLCLSDCVLDSNQVQLALLACSRLCWIVMSCAAGSFSRELACASSGSLVFRFHEPMLLLACACAP